MKINIAQNSPLKMDHFIESDWFNSKYKLVLFYKTNPCMIIHIVFIIIPLLVFFYSLCATSSSTSKRTKAKMTIKVKPKVE